METRQPKQCNTHAHQNTSKKATPSKGNPRHKQASNAKQMQTNPMKTIKTSATQTQKQQIANQKHKTNNTLSIQHDLANKENLIGDTETHKGNQ